jgi:cytochrome oxidase assembly protein ShyY1
MIASHVGGVPLEEILLPLASGAGAGLLLARGWVLSRVRRQRSPRDDRQQTQTGR